MKQFYITFISCLFFTITFGQIPAYYNGIDFSQPAATVEAELKTLVTNVSAFNQKYITRSNIMIKIIALKKLGFFLGFKFLQKRRK